VSPSGPTPAQPARSDLLVRMELLPHTSSDAQALTAFLREVDLTLSGLDEPTVRLWAQRDADGAIVASTGYEMSADGRHALIRSVAVSPAHRSRGRGSALARFALEAAAEEGARTAWLFSRRSGPFWQGLGFAPADRDDLADALAHTHQVRLFRETGQLEQEVAWSRPLDRGGLARECSPVGASSTQHSEGAVT
jgi:N-acetylglutamate synthase-like GNAT family acetyltransferase